MSQRPASVVLALVVGLCSASISWAQNGVQVPAQQTVAILSRQAEIHNDSRENSHPSHLRAAASSSAFASTQSPVPPVLRCCFFQKGAWVFR